MTRAEQLIFESWWDVVNCFFLEEDIYAIHEQMVKDYTNQMSLHLARITDDTIMESFYRSVLYGKRR